jgi:hypothetical protein
VLFVPSAGWWPFNDTSWWSSTRESFPLDVDFEFIPAVARARRATSAESLELVTIPSLRLFFGVVKSAG